MDNNELMHYGILGMKWGIRRYQNKDGTLTAAGKKRKAKLESQLNELDGQKKSGSSGSTSSSGKDSTKELSDADLKTRINRTRLETEALRSQKQYDDLYKELNPETVSKGKKFVDESMNNVVKPAVTEASKHLLTGYLKKIGSKALGLNTDQAEDYVSKLQKEVKKMNLEKQYKKLKEEAAGNKKSESSESKTDDADSASSKSTKSDDDRTVYSGTVEDGPSGSSSSSSNSSSRSNSSDTIIDVEWRDVTVSNARNDVRTAVGQNYVAGLLEDNSQK